MHNKGKIFMKKSMVAIAAAVMALGSVASAETLTEYEARVDTAKGGLYLLFVSRAVSEDAPMGDAFMILGKGESPAAVTAEINYGIRLDRGIPKLGKISDEDAAAIRASAGPQPVMVSAVRVDQAQYDEVKSLLDEWAAKTAFDIPEANALLDCTQEAIRAIGFKRPYRAGLLTPHLMNYYGDIQIVNRKRAV